MRLIQLTLTTLLTSALFFLGAAIFYASLVVNQVSVETIKPVNKTLSQWHQSLPETLHQLQGTAEALNRLSEQIEKATPTTKAILEQSNRMNETAGKLAHQAEHFAVMAPDWITKTQKIADTAHETVIKAGRISENSVDGIIKGIVTSPVTAISALITSPNKAVKTVTEAGRRPHKASESEANSVNNEGN